jgi:hypothetical protein
LCRYERKTVIFDDQSIIAMSFRETSGQIPSGHLGRDVLYSARVATAIAQPWGHLDGVRELLRVNPSTHAFKQQCEDATSH